ncbi:MAG: hypothetical protein EA374_00890 [Acholeplasmatales bacterium]|nr:MAG: hypothetical protein EA374_00890 [Acholeplasmatales bacterium]
MHTTALQQELMDALHGHTCPLCAVIERSLKTQIGHILYESVNDGILRSRYIEKDGFCHRHGKLMRAVGDPLAHAILYGHLLKMRLSSWQKPRPKPLKQGCLLCVRETEIETHVISAFTHCLKADDFLTAYRNNGLVCQDHFHQIALNPARRAHAEVLEGFKRVTLDKYAQLLHHLEELARKHDYRYADEPRTQAERVAWQEIVDLLGKKR